jgi:hypothetical protein
MVSDTQHSPIASLSLHYRSLELCINCRHSVTALHPFIQTHKTDVSSEKNRTGACSSAPPLCLACGHVWGKHADRCRSSCFWHTTYDRPWHRFQHSFVLEVLCRRSTIARRSSSVSGALLLSPLGFSLCALLPRQCSIRSGNSLSPSPLSTAWC